MDIDEDSEPIRDVYMYAFAFKVQLHAYILEDFENASPHFCTFLANRIRDCKVTRRFYCATQNWNESVVNLTALSRDAADDATWVHTASSTCLHS